MYDPDTLNTDEPDWLPPPPPPDAWRRWEGRVKQGVILNLVGIGIPVVLGLVRLIPTQITLWLLLCVGPALLVSWCGLVAYFVTRAAENSGTQAERGRMLVLLLDVLTVVFTMIGIGFWIAILTRT
jgi:hypothetical protein